MLVALLGAVLLVAGQTVRTTLRPDMNRGDTLARGAKKGGSLSPGGLPGTSVRRQAAAVKMVSMLRPAQLNGDWGELRTRLLDSCGLAETYPTSHCFADYNHVDCCTMLDDFSANENDGRVDGMHHSNQLGGHITAASDPSHGPGGSWCTCHVGSGKAPPRDICHVQFESAIAFKLVWCPGPDTAFRSYVLLDDSGALLATGTPSGGDIPDLEERRENYAIVQGSKYALACVTNPA